MKNQLTLTLLFASYLASGHAEEHTRRRRLVQPETWMASDSLKEDEPYWSRLLEVVSMSSMPDKGDDDDDDGDIPVPVPVSPGEPTEGDDDDDDSDIPVPVPVIPVPVPVSPVEPTEGDDDDEDDNTFSPSPPTASPNEDTSSPTASGDIAPVLEAISNDSPVASP